MQVRLAEGAAAADWHPDAQIFFPELIFFLRCRYDSQKARLLQTGIQTRKYFFPELIFFLWCRYDSQKARLLQTGIQTRKYFFPELIFFLWFRYDSQKARLLQTGIQTRMFLIEGDSAGVHLPLPVRYLSLPSVTCRSSPVGV